MADNGPGDVFDLYARAYADRDAQAVAALFDPDGQLFSPDDPPALGREAIMARHVDWFSEPEQDKILEVIETQVAGDLGYALVGFASTMQDDTGRDTRVCGMSLNTLSRSGGLWRIRHCCLSFFDTPPEGFPR